MNLKRDCKGSRNRKKQTECQSKLEITMKKAETKDNKDNILWKKLNKNFQKAVKRDKKQYCNSNCKDAKDGSSYGKGKIFQEISETQKKFQP